MALNKQTIINNSKKVFKQDRNEQGIYYVLNG